MNFTPVNVDRAYRASFRAEDRAARLWHKNWNWLIDEYRIIYNELRVLKCRKLELFQIVEEEDNRTTRPFPETTNHEYGHLVCKPEFVLEKFSSPGLTPLKKSLPKSDLYNSLDNKITQRYSRSKCHGFLNYYTKTTPQPKATNRFGLTLL